MSGGLEDRKDCNRLGFAGGGGGLWGEAAAAGLGGVYSEEVEWERDEGDVERELDMLLPLAR